MNLETQIDSYRLRMIEFNRFEIRRLAARWLLVVGFSIIGALIGMVVTPDLFVQLLFGVLGGLCAHTWIDTPLEKMMDRVHRPLERVLSLEPFTGYVRVHDTNTEIDYINLAINPGSTLPHVMGGMNQVLRGSNYVHLKLPLTEEFNFTVQTGEADVYIVYANREPIVTTTHVSDAEAITELLTQVYALWHKTKEVAVGKQATTSPSSHQCL